jgi:tyrosine-protein phosphatase SIW14
MFLRPLAALTIVATILASPYAYSVLREKQIRNFRVVDEGILYRSAQLSKDGLARIIHDHNIRTVVSLRYSKDGKPAEDEWEVDFCSNLGVRHFRIRLADEAKAAAAAAGKEDAKVVFEAGVAKFIEVMRDPKHHPVLVHCYRGVHRTGAQCAVYRIEFNGWSKEDAIEEMRTRGYDVIDEHADLRGFLESYVPKAKSK